MTNRLLSYLLLLLFTLTARSQTIADMGMAREWCDNALLQQVEGIWEFPSDETFVLVRKSVTDANRYDLLVVQTPDCRLMPGEKIGWLDETPLADTYEMHLCRDRRNGILGNSEKCLAEYKSADDAMVVSGRKLKLSFNMRWFLPAFWKILRVSPNVKSDDPARKIPYGMRRVYPLKVRRTIDYL